MGQGNLDIGITLHNLKTPHEKSNKIGARSNTLKRCILIFCPAGGSCLSSEFNRTSSPLLRLLRRSYWKSSDVKVNISGQNRDGRSVLYLGNEVCLAIWFGYMKITFRGDFFWSMRSMGRVQTWDPFSVDYHVRWNPLHSSVGEGKIACICNAT